MSIVIRRLVAPFLCLATLAASPADTAKPKPSEAHHALKLTSKDERLLALTMWAEARSRGPKAMRSIGHVVVNRARTGDYGKGVSGVVWSPGQFGCWRAKDPNRKAMRNLAALDKDGADWKSWQEAKSIAHQLVSGASSDPTRGATHYAQSYLKPHWVKGSRYLATVGGYKFYRERPDGHDRATRT